MWSDDLIKMAKAGSIGGEQWEKLKPSSGLQQADDDEAKDRIMYSQQFNENPDSVCWKQVMPILLTFNIIFLLSNPLQSSQSYVILMRVGKFNANL